MSLISILPVLRTIFLRIAPVLFVASALHQNTHAMESSFAKIVSQSSPASADKPSPISLPQTYQQLRIDLLPEIIRHIFSLQLKASGVDLVQLKSEVEECDCINSYEFADDLAGYSNRLIKSCGYNLGPALFKWLFPDAKISVRDIKNKIGSKAWRFEVGKICIALEENTYRDIQISSYSWQ